MLTRLARLAAVLLLFVAAPLLRGQEARGTLLGRVTDSSGAVIPGVSITVTNVATGVSIPVESNADGNYLAPFLIPGNYRVAAEKTGFKRSIREGIEVRVNDRIVLDIVLDVGEVRQSVTVTGETPLLDSADASAGTVIDAKRVAELPIVHGDPFHLISLAAGVAFMGDMSMDQPYETHMNVAYAVSGSRNQSAEDSIDGIPNTAPDNYSAGKPTFIPPADAVAEIKIQTAVFDASVGQTTGPSVNVSLKSGTNALHGTAYWAKMSPEMTANLFFQNATGVPRQTFNYNRWGAMASGPVTIPKVYNGRNRTFFMYAYEFTHNANPRGTNLTVPTVQRRQGDFSDLLQLGDLYQIYDPLTARVAAGHRFQRDPLPGNIIPAARMDPIAKKLVNYYPLPTSPGNVDGTNNFTDPSEPQRVNYVTHTARVDHNISERHRLYGRVNRSDAAFRDPDYFKNIMGGTRFWYYSSGFGLDDVYTWSPSLITNIRVGEARIVSKSSGNPAGAGIDLTTFGFSPYFNNLIDPGIRRLPGISITGYQKMGGRNDVWQPKETRTLGGTVDKVTGSHTLRAGMEYRQYRQAEYNLGQNSTGAQLNFTAAYTSGPFDNSPTLLAPKDQALASFLFGLPSGGSYMLADTYAAQSTVWSAYFKDDWKATRKLTVNLGLRYELEGPVTERYNRTVRGFDPNFVQPTEAQARANYAKDPIPELPPADFKVRGGLTFAGVGGQPRTLWDRNTKNFMPRIGLAYSLTRKTVFRAGYGIYFSNTGLKRTTVDLTGFSQTTNLIASNDGGMTFVASLANPFPNGFLKPTGATLGAQTNVGGAISFYNGHPLSPYTQRWQFDVQRELPGRFLLDMAYVGSKTIHMDVFGIFPKWGTGAGFGATTGYDLNALPDSYLSRSPVRDQATIDYLTANLPNPFLGVIPSAMSRGGTYITRAALLTPYPEYTSVSTTRNSSSNWYHSLQVSTEKRFSAGYTVQATYTWSKFMDAVGFLNGGDPRPSEVISEQDFPQHLAVSGIYELPVGRGRKFFRNAPPVVSQMIDGWQLTGIYIAQSGAAFGFGNALFTGNLHNIPLPESQRTLNRWFNTDAGFERDPKKQLSYNLRTMSYRFNGCRTDGINNWDLSATKKTRLREGMTLDFRAEFLNAFNHPQFKAPDTLPTSVTFGMVTVQNGYPRRIQLQIKLVY